MFLVFRTPSEVLQRNNCILLHIYCTLCSSTRNRDGSEGFLTEQGYLVTDVRGIFELFLDLDSRSPCLALFPHPWFPSSWARPSAYCLACTYLWELTLVPVFLSFYQFFSSWNWCSVLTHTKMASSKSLAFSRHRSWTSHPVPESDSPALPLVSSVDFSIWCSVTYELIKSVLFTFEAFTWQENQRKEVQSIMVGKAWWQRWLGSWQQ